MHAIIGNGGFAREVHNMLSFDLNINEDEIFYIIQDGEDKSQINQINEYDFLNNDKECKAYIAVGDPELKKKIYEKYKNKSNIVFPNIISNSSYINLKNVRVGIGNIVCANTSLTTNIEIGNFVHINLNSTIGHDVEVKNFCTISPGCNVSGNVLLDDCTFLGTNSSILESIKISKNVKIGAGAVVISDINENHCTYVGVPAKMVKK